MRGMFNECDTILKDVTTGYYSPRCSAFKTFFEDVSQFF